MAGWQELPDWAPRGERGWHEGPSSPRFPMSHGVPRQHPEAGDERRDRDEGRERGKREHRVPRDRPIAHPQTDEAQRPRKHLSGGEQGVARAGCHERCARDPRGEERIDGEAPEQLVSRQLDAVEAMPSDVEECATGDDRAESPRQDANLSLELAPRCRCHGLPCDRTRSEHEAASGSDDTRRDVEIVGDVRSDAIDQLPTDGVDGTGRGDHVTCATLCPLELAIEVPIAALTAVRPAAPGSILPGRDDALALSRRQHALVEIPLIAGDSADAWVRERCHQSPECGRLPHRVRIGERDDLARRRVDRGLERGGLADAGQVEDVDAWFVDRSREVDGPIGRAVRGDDDLETVDRIVQRQKIPQPILDRPRLVMSREDHADRRCDVAGRVGRRPQSAANEDGTGQGDVDEAEDRDRSPEQPATDHDGSPADGPIPDDLATAAGEIAPFRDDRATPPSGPRSSPAAMVSRKDAARRAAFRSRSKLSITRARPARPQASPSARSPASRRRASARADASPGVTSAPVTPSTTSSGIPDRRLATTGRPLAIASMSTTGMPSRLPDFVGTLGATRTSTSWWSREIADRSRAPRSSTRSLSPAEWIRFARSPRRGPSPTIRTCTSTPSATSERHASIRTAWPLRGVSDPTWRISRACARVRTVWSSGGWKTDVSTPQWMTRILS